MAILTRKTFIDTAIFIAFVDRADANHQKSVQVMENMARLGYTLYTSSHNMIEAYATISREISPSVAMDFLQAALVSDIEILFPQKTDFISALKILKTNKDRQISLRESLNATLMQKRGVMQIITFTYWHNLFGTYVSNLSLS